MSIGALVKTIAGAVPEAQFRPMAHSMRPHLSNISRFQSIAVVQPRAKGLYEHFSVPEWLVGLFSQPQTMEILSFRKGKPMVGTPQWATVSTHSFSPPKRRSPGGYFGTRHLHGTLNPPLRPSCGSKNWYILSHDLHSGPQEALL